MAGLVVALAPSAAHADPDVDAAVVVFTAGATVDDDLYAPLLNPAPLASTGYEFSTNDRGLGDALMCVGVARQNGVNSTGAYFSSDPTNVVQEGDAASCTLNSTGVVNASAPFNAPHCGWSEGSGTAGGNIGTASLDVNVRWDQSAGTLLPLVFTDDDDNTVGVGAVQSTGAGEGRCGATPPGGTRTFDVTGFAALAVPTGV
jgi:hypothetical protein